MSRNGMLINLLYITAAVSIFTIALKSIFTSNFYQFLSSLYYIVMFILVIMGFAGILGLSFISVDIVLILAISVNIAFLVFTRITERKND